MKDIIILLTLFGSIFLSVGIDSHISQINNPSVGGTLFGLSSSTVFIILGGLLFLIDFLLVYLYYKNKRKHSQIDIN